jgi:hypothetical protein
VQPRLSTVSPSARGQKLRERDTSYFHFKDHKGGEPVTRPAYLGQRLRLTFETDVENEYFRRSLEPGEIAVEATLNARQIEVTHAVNLFNGLAHLNVSLPETATAGDSLSLTVTVTDWTLVEEFVNHASIDIHGEIAPHPGPGGKRGSRNPKGRGDKTEPRPGGIQLPQVEWAYEADWNRESFITPMNQFSGMRAAIADAADETTGTAKYDFYVNADNIFLHTELKVTKQDPELVRAKFRYGMTLVGLGALRRAGEFVGGRADPDNESDAIAPAADQSEEGLVAMASDVLAPMLLPMIDGLGSLELEEAGIDQSPDAQDLTDSLSD